MTDLTKVIDDTGLSTAANDRLYARFLRGCAYSRLKQYDAALMDLSGVIATAPTAIAYYERSLVYLAKGDKVRSSADYRKAIALDPKVGK